jgi:putative PIG3 family NAD(P)H quinone oxidoreductase
MRGVALKGFGGPEMLQYTTELLRPVLPNPNYVMIKVAATALNRADTMQRKGHYPAPPGESEILGLEAAGTICEIGPEVRRWKEGDRVMALVPGGGYAENVVVHESHVMPVPEGMSFVDAAAIPEVFLTAYQALRFQSNLQAGDTLLMHAGASGVGTAACQLARLFGAKSITTSSEGKVEECKKFADFAVSRTKDENGKIFASKVTAAIGANKVNVVIDPVFGGGYLEESTEVMALDGQVVVLAFMGGNTIKEFNATPLFRKRIGIKFSTLRSQNTEYKAKLIKAFSENALPAFSDGRLKPVIDTVFPVEDVVKAHEKLDASDSVGKIILRFE